MGRRFGHAHRRAHARHAGREDLARRPRGHAVLGPPQGRSGRHGVEFRREFGPGPAGAVRDRTRRRAAARGRGAGGRHADGPRLRRHRAAPGVPAAAAGLRQQTQGRRRELSRRPRLAAGARHARAGHRQAELGAPPGARAAGRLPVPRRQRLGGRHAARHADPHRLRALGQCRLGVRHQPRTDARSPREDHRAAPDRGHAEPVHGARHAGDAGAGSRVPAHRPAPRRPAPSPGGARHADPARPARLRLDRAHRRRDRPQPALQLRRAGHGGRTRLRTRRLEAGLGAGHGASTSAGRRRCCRASRPTTSRRDRWRRPRCPTPCRWACTVPSWRREAAGGPGAQAAAHQPSSKRPCRKATKPDTLPGTSLGDGKTACISCSGSAWSPSTSRTLPAASESLAT